MANRLAAIAAARGDGSKVVANAAQRLTGKPLEGLAENVAEQVGIDNGSTAGVAPAPMPGAPVDPSGVDQFAGKKFEISPVQMKGSFSNKSRENAKGVYGDEEERKNSLKR